MSPTTAANFSFDRVSTTAAVQMPHTRSSATWRPSSDRTESVQMISGIAALRRAPRLADVAEAAAFLASDRAAGITGSMANVTCGLVLR